MKHKSQRRKFVHFWHPITAYHACHGLEKKWICTSLKAHYDRQWPFWLDVTVLHGKTEFKNRR